MYKILRWLYGLIGGELRPSVNELYRSMTRGKPLNDKEIERLQKGKRLNQALISDYAKHWRLNNRCKELLQVRTEKISTVKDDVVLRIIKQHYGEKFDLVKQTKLTLNTLTSVIKETNRRRDEQT